MMGHITGRRRGGQSYEGSGGSGGPWQTRHALWLQIQQQQQELAESGTEAEAVGTRASLAGLRGEEGEGKPSGSSS